LASLLGNKEYPEDTDSIFKDLLERKENDTCYYKCLCQEDIL
jgi:hypothetical protein